ncbi:MAG: UDP-N-acetylmuramoyl-L-alanyl-D-glutamate--2,6-diaminopimelate ligase [Puniceicoccales bacterium]|jgi:UDP-N-acetylmuramoyl-L-alanyl-D-glutamate--2,6-diaminopimelate ligase|nr:UDP-N-acetylmuramoyl-L-alanyl-D-glutamate--2,6-diaminopimelate ligase [Puniceicoccales bacterium]
MSLQDIFQGIDVVEFSGNWKSSVSCLRTDSRRAGPGCAFFALPGLKTQGLLFIEEAIARGASAIVSETPSGSHSHLAWVRVANIRAALAAAARNFHGHPEKKLALAGVTGTNGKTTVTTLAHHLLQHDGRPWGLVGTVRYALGTRSLPAHRTTPESLDLCEMMAHMLASDCEGAVMEISSHAIVQERVSGFDFKALAFTNLSHDHLDYHGDMETYFQVKARPFLGLTGKPPTVAIINSDDPAGRRLANMMPGGVDVLTFGINEEARLRATDIQLQAGQSTFTFSAPGLATAVSTSLPGHYNISNILCALGICHALGRNLGTILPIVTNFPGVPGRMERVAPSLPFQIFVDYAHTDDALANALEMLRAITPGRLLVVFGCGGNRDRAKRPAMTKAAQRFADFAWATADNPRKEPQKMIFEDMRAGILDAHRITFVEDRRRAISLALDTAHPGDTLLIAGKGHETYQEFADITVPFDDRQVAHELLLLKQQRLV